MDESLHRYESIVNASPDFMTLIDRDYRYAAANDAFCAAHQAPREEVIGCTVAQMWGEASFSEKIKEFLDRCLEGEVASYEAWFEVPDSGLRHFDVTYTPYRDRRGAVTHALVVSRDTTVRKRAEEALHYRSEFERTITDLSSRFVRLRPDEVDGAITDALEAIGRLAGVDRSYVFVLRENSALMDNTHEWCAPGIDSQTDILQGIALDETAPWVAEKFRAFEVVHVPSVSELPPEASVEKRLFQSLEILSFINVPMVCAGNLRGILGFDSVKTEKEWSADIIAVLESAAEVFANALERKRNDLALRESEEKYRSFVENFPGIAFRGSLDFTAIFCHGAVEKITGYTESELQTDEFRWDRLVHPEDAPRFYAEGERIRSIPRFRCEREYRIIRKDGETRWIREIAQNVCGDSGEPIHVEGIVLDVSERIRIKKALERSEARYRSLVDHLPTVTYIAALDEQSTTLYISPQIEDLIGFTPDEYRENPEIWTERLHPEDKDRVLKEVAASHATGEVFASEYRMIARDGRTVWFRDEAALVCDESGTPLNLQGVMLDITAQKRNEEERHEFEIQMQQAQKLESLGILAGGIAHDFNNILTVVLGNAEMALTEISEPERVKESIQEIMRSAKRAAGLSHQMLAYSGKGRLAIKSVDLNTLVHELDHLLKSSISKNVLLEYDFLESLPAVEADVSQLQQVLLNLVVNGSEAIGEEPGVVNISTGQMYCDPEYLKQTFLYEDQKEGRYVYIRVRDTGCGMDTTTAAKVFDPFFTTKFTGRGLGLAATLGIVRGHSGAISIDSSLGNGTTFTVLFPASPAPIESDLRVKDVDGAGPGQVRKTILVIDDDVDVRDACTRMLRSAGYDVLGAKNGPEGVEIYRERADEIDGVLLDLTVSDSDSHETLNELHKIDPDVCVVLPSGNGEKGTEERPAGEGLPDLIESTDLPHGLAQAMKQLPGL